MADGDHLHFITQFALDKTYLHSVAFEQYLLQFFKILKHDDLFINNTLERRNQDGPSNVAYALRTQLLKIQDCGAVPSRQRMRRSSVTYPCFARGLLLHQVFTQVRCLRLTLWSFRFYYCVFSVQVPLNLAMQREFSSNSTETSHSNKGTCNVIPYSLLTSGCRRVRARNNSED